MKEISADFEGNVDDAFFDPLGQDGEVLRCCCGYELIKEDEDTYRCTGGSHRYRISEEEVHLDVYGNVMLKKPVAKKDGKKMGQRDWDKKMRDRGKQ